MSLKLSATRLFTPKATLLRELDRVAEMTTAVLDALVEEMVPGTLEALREGDPLMEGDLEQRRIAMATVHERRVASMVEAVGDDEAVRRGRKRLFPVGERLGAEARQRLGVGEDLGDLVDAATVMYRVLGINFEPEERDDGTLVLHIDRCALSEGYSEVTCRLMSAADEGMIRGLNPDVEMTFRERITGGCPACLADLTLRTVETQTEEPDEHGGEGP